MTKWQLSSVFLDKKIVLILFFIGLNVSNSFAQFYYLENASLFKQKYLCTKKQLIGVNFSNDYSTKESDKNLNLNYFLKIIDKRKVKFNIDLVSSFHFTRSLNDTIFNLRHGDSTNISRAQFSFQKFWNNKTWSIISPIIGISTTIRNDKATIRPPDESYYKFFGVILTNQLSRFGLEVSFCKNEPHIYRILNKGGYTDYFNAAPWRNNYFIYVKSPVVYQFVTTFKILDKKYKWIEIGFGLKYAHYYNTVAYFYEDKYYLIRADAVLNKFSIKFRVHNSNFDVRSLFRFLEKSIELTTVSKNLNFSLKYINQHSIFNWNYNQIAVGVSYSF